MLRNLLRNPSTVQQFMHELAVAHPHHHVAVAAPCSQLTSLRQFAAGTDDKDTTPAAAPKAKDPPSSATAAAATTSATTSALQNTKLWRQWIDGRLDDRHPVPRYSTKQDGSAAAGSSGGGPRAPKKFRTKDPAKDWKNASRSLRSTQDRMASIMVPENERDGAQPSGRYGILGTAADAPRHVPGAAARAEEVSPVRLLPHRLFYPGATYVPEELDPYKAKPVSMISDLTVRRGAISPQLVAASADFRNPKFLNNFITDAGKLLPRRRLRLPAKLHREVKRQVKQARALGLMCPTAKIVEKREYPPAKGGKPPQRGGGSGSKESGGREQLA